MPGAIGEARGNDIVPNGPILPLNTVNLPGTVTLATYASYGNASVLNVLGSGTFSISTIALPTAGVAHAAGVEIYVPVNGAPTLYINGSGSVALTLYMNRYSEV